MYCMIGITFAIAMTLSVVEVPVLLLLVSGTVPHMPKGTSSDYSS